MITIHGKETDFDSFMLRTVLGCICSQGRKYHTHAYKKPVTLPHISLRSKSYEISCPSNRFLQYKYTFFVSKCNVFLSSNENLNFHSSYSETIAYNTLTGAILKI